MCWDICVINSKSNLLHILSSNVQQLLLSDFNSLTTNICRLDLTPHGKSCVCAASMQVVGGICVGVSYGFCTDKHIEDVL